MIPVSLRGWRADDVPSLVKYANNRDVAKNLRDRFPFPYTQKDAEEWIAFAAARDPLEHLAIEVEAHAVGGVGLILGTDIARRSAEIGYWLGEPWWGRGIATRALQLATDYAFANFDLVRIFAGVFEGNPASARVLEKAGYTLESRARKAVFKEGRVLDQLNYVMIR
jgi:RimJ/RimL family protein N-acetyltransferase